MIVYIYTSIFRIVQRKKERKNETEFHTPVTKCATVNNIIKLLVAIFNEATKHGLPLRTYLGFSVPQGAQGPDPHRLVEDFLAPMQCFVTTIHLETISPPEVVSRLKSIRRFRSTNTREE